MDVGALLVFFIYLGILVQVIMPPDFRMSLSSSVRSLWKAPHRHAWRNALQGCFEGMLDAKSITMKRRQRQGPQWLKHLPQNHTDLCLRSNSQNPPEAKHTTMHLQSQYFYTNLGLEEQEEIPLKTQGLATLEQAVESNKKTLSQRG